MGWASFHITKLKRGETVQFRPIGNSMKPKVKSGQLVTVVPLEGGPRVGDIVLCKVKGKEYLHLVKAERADSYQIGNSQGRINGWIRKSSIFGVCIKVED